MLIDCAVNAHSTTRQYDDVKVSIKSINNKNYFLFGIFSFTGTNHLLADVWCDIIKISVDFHNRFTFLPSNSKQGGIHFN